MTQNEIHALWSCSKHCILFCGKQDPEATTYRISPPFDSNMSFIGSTQLYLIWSTVMVFQLHSKMFSPNLQFLLRQTISFHFVVNGTEDVMGLDAATLHHLWECSEVHQLPGRTLTIRPLRAADWFCYFFLWADSGVAELKMALGWMPLFKAGILVHQRNIKKPEFQGTIGTVCRNCYPSTSEIVTASPSRTPHSGEKSSFQLRFNRVEVCLHLLQTLITKVRAPNEVQAYSQWTYCGSGPRWRCAEDSTTHSFARVSDDLKRFRESLEHATWYWKFWTGHRRWWTIVSNILIWGSRLQMFWTIQATLRPTILLCIVQYENPPMDWACSNYTCWLLHGVLPGRNPPDSRDVWPLDGIQRTRFQILQWPTLLFDVVCCWFLMSCWCTSWCKAPVVFPGCRGKRSRTLSL